MLAGARISPIFEKLWARQKEILSATAGGPAIRPRARRTARGARQHAGATQLVAATTGTAARSATDI